MSTNRFPEAEIVGLMLGVHLLRSLPPLSLSSCAADNTSCIQASIKRTLQPGHYLLDDFHAQVSDLHCRHRRLDLVLRWVPGHRDVPGNELADSEAKKAAAGASSAPSLLPRTLCCPLPPSASKLRQTHLEGLHLEASQCWRSSPRFPKIQRIDPSLPSKSFGKLVRRLPRRHASLLFQLRSGHAPLNKHLHAINAVDSALCPACELRPETVIHFLFECPAYSVPRYALTRKFGRAARSLSFLLSSGVALKPLFAYIHATGRFSTVFGSLALDS